MFKLLTIEEMQAGLPDLRQSPQDKGRLEMIVCRPAVDQRQVLDQAELDLVEGLIGDNWHIRGSSSTDDGSAHPEMQIAIMNSRLIHLIALDQARWPLAGDQLFIDLDMSRENLPIGQHLAIGSAVLEVTKMPHNGCKKFAERFGPDATRFVNSPQGKQMRLRGVNMRVVRPGTIHIGDTVTKIDPLHET